MLEIYVLQFCAKIVDQENGIQSMKKHNTRTYDAKLETYKF